MRDNFSLMKHYIKLSGQNFKKKMLFDKNFEKYILENI